MHAAVAFANLSGPLPLELGELAGAIPPRWSRLCALQALDLSDNLLAGAIPSELGDLANLTMLNLMSNFLSGTIPEQAHRRRPAGLH